MVYHNPFEPNTARPLYHFLVIAAAGAWAATISNSRLLCTYSETSSSLNVMTLTWGLVYAPFLLFFIVGGSLYAAVSALLSRDRHPISRLARQRVMQAAHSMA